MIVVAAIGVVVGIVWGLIAPAKKAKGGPPNSRAFGSTYSQDADAGPAPTYESKFSAPTEPKDDGAFGHGTADESGGEDA